MSGRDVAQIVRDLEKIGLRLSVIRRLDGSLRLDRWRTMAYWGNANEAERLWSEVVGDDPAVMDELAMFIENQDATPLGNKDAASLIAGLSNGAAPHGRIQ